jgi:hypothetical protein
MTAPHDASPYNPSCVRAFPPGRSRLFLAALTVLTLAVPAAAQDWLSEPIVLGHGRVTLAGDASVTFSCADTGGACGDDTGFFNYSDYDHSTLRMLRLDINASVRANPHVSFLAEVRTENGSLPTPYALYVRWRPWQHRAFDIQAGRVPPTFGAFARRTYANDNLLIGYPLAYQYLTPLRADAVPADADELLRMRARGWESSFSLGNTAPDRGLPLASAFRWDTGIQAHGATDWIDATLAVTTGSLSHPLVVDDNGGKQVTGRVALHPVPGLVIGVSGAHGPFLDRDVVRDTGRGSETGDFVQKAVGADVEYSRDYYLVRIETILSAWTLPTIAEPVRALGTSVEGRYKIRPGFYAAARIDHLGFSELRGETIVDTWDAPVSRVEMGIGYLLRRNLQLKTSWQRNTRDGGRVTHSNLGAVQIGFWF